MEENPENLYSSIEEPENADSSISEEEVELEVVEGEEPETPDKEEKSQEFSDLEKQQHEQIQRLKKKLKKQQAENPPDAPNLSTKDFLALNEAGITAEDIDDVQEFAAFKKMTISEALKHSTLKTILTEKAEERKTAQATSTKSPRGVSKTTGEDLLRKAEKTGEIPQSDRGMEELIKARLERKRVRK